MGFFEDYINKQLDKESETQEVGIAGFTAFARVNESTEFKSRAPTAYLEDGSFVNDHIINEPITITISGTVSDVFVQKTNVENLINQANSLIGQTSIYLPLRTQSQIQKANGLISSFRDRVRQVDRAIETGNKILNLGQSSGVSDQQRFVDQLKLIRDTRKPVNIDMNYKQYKLMVITSLVITKNYSSNDLEFKLTAQQLRIAKPIYRDNDSLKKNPSEGVTNQTDGAKDKGAQTGKQPEQSILNYTFDQLGIFQ